MTTYLSLVDDFIQQLLRDQDAEPLQDTLDELQQRLRKPLRLAVTGAVSAGKSTLVNSLIGRRLGSTGEGEVTTFTTVFQYADSPDQERVQVRHNGSPGTEIYGLADLATLEDLDDGNGDPVVAFVHHPLLERLTVIDTPGLYSSSAGVSDRTRRLVAERTRRSAAGAGAVVHLSRDLPGRKLDLQLLDEFRSLFGLEVRRAVTNTLFVLSGVDGHWQYNWLQAVLGLRHDPGGPLELGHSLLTRDASIRSALHARVWDAVPVVALLAETVRTTDLVDARLCSEAKTLAAAVCLDDVLLDQSDFLEFDLPGIDRTRREELWTRLDSYGLFVLADAGSKEAEPEMLSNQLLAASGIQVLEDVISRLFRGRDELIVADDVMSQLEREITSSAALLGRDRTRRLRDRVDDLRMDKRGLGLRQLRALRIALDEKIKIPDERRSELRALFGENALPARLQLADTSSSSEILAHVRRQRAWWAAVAAVVPDSAERRWLANTVVTTYEEMADAFLA